MVTVKLLLNAAAVVGLVTGGAPAVVNSNGVQRRHTTTDAPALSSSTVHCPTVSAPAADDGDDDDGGGGGGARKMWNEVRRPKVVKGKVRQRDNDDTEENEQAHIYDRDGKYWLVPPFLIGASSIVVIYVFVHCVYTHCNCSGDDKRNRRNRPGYGNGGPVPVRRVQIAGHGGPNSTSGQTFYLSGDAMTAAGAGATGGATGNRLVPLVCYDDAGTATASAGSGGTNAYGRTQLVEAQPFLIYEQCDDSLDYCEDSMVVPSTPKKETGSGFLQLPAAIGRRLSQARLSLSSIGRSSTGGGGGDGRGDGTGGARSREPRASLCFLPVSRAISDPSCVLQPAGSQGELGGAGGARFESYYCRSCGCHNVIDVGRPSVVSVTSPVANGEPASSPPLPTRSSDNTATANATAADGDIPIGGGSTSTSGGTARVLPVPTITFDNDEDGRPENCETDVVEGCHGKEDKDTSCVVTFTTGGDSCVVVDVNCRPNVQQH